MDYVNLGRTGLKVSRLCLGTMNLGVQTSEADSLAILDRALALGLNFIDTANIYGGQVEGTDYYCSKTEEIIGSWLSQGGGRRENIVLATKMMGPLGPGPNQRGLSAAHIIKACEDSLKRLKTDHIDLYQMHGFAPDTPLDEMWQAMEVLVQQGKIIYVGSSNCPGWYIVEANMTARQRNMFGLVSEQCGYNLANRRAELDVFPVAERFGVGLIPYGPLASGILAGGVLAKPADGRRSGELVRNLVEYFRERILKWEKFCEEFGEKPADLALAWVLSKPVLTSPIIGPRTVTQLVSSLRALEIDIDPENMKRIDEIWPPFGVTK